MPGIAVQDDPVKIAGKPPVPARAVTIRWVEAASSDTAAPRSSSSLLPARVAEEAEKQQHDDDDDDDQENAERWPPFGVGASLFRDASSRKRDPAGVRQSEQV